MMVNVVGLLINSAFLHSMKTTSLTLEENSEFYQYVLFIFFCFSSSQENLHCTFLHFIFVYIKAPKPTAQKLVLQLMKSFLIYIELPPEWLLTYIIFTPECCSNKIFYHQLQPSSYPSTFVMFKHSMSPQSMNNAYAWCIVLELLNVVWM